jgi:hypothetical protein
MGQGAEIAPKVDEPEEQKSFIQMEMEKAKITEAGQASFTIHPVDGALGIYCVEIVSPKNWKRAHLIVDGRSICMVTPEIIKSQNKTRRQGLSNLKADEDTKVRVKALNTAVSPGKESKCFLWDFGVSGVPPDLRILVHTAGNEIAVGSL